MNQGPDRRLWSVVMARAGGAAVTVAHVCTAITTVSGVDGTAVVLATSATVRETVYTDDEMAAQVEELTLTLGEGPGQDAVRQGEPILSPDVAGSDALARWPVFAPAATALGALAVFALPLRIGAIRLGALTMYRRRPGSLSRAQFTDGLALADVVCMLLVNRTGPSTDAATGPAADAVLGGSDWYPESDGVRYPEVHQATGMIIVQLGVSAEVAFARLRAHAFVRNRRLRDVARDVVARRLRFNADGDDYAEGR